MKRQFGPTARHVAGLSKMVACAALLGTVAPSAGAEPVRSLLEIRRDRVVVQEWDLSCGAAALATLLNHQLDDPVSEREIALGLMHRAEYVADPTLVIRRWGFSLLDLKRYVVQRGYAGIGYGQLELADLIDLAPAIVPINVAGYNHFVVFRGLHGNRVLLADPAWGNRTMTVDQFEDAWLRYAGLGRVGFVVAHADGTLPPNQLAPLPADFVFLR
jgi:predicted double-glycine peptidase